jgi:DDE superfamily endonuclease
MDLWTEVVRSGYGLAGACRRRRTFMWLLVVLVAWIARPDLLGVTSLVRGSFLSSASYPLLLNFFHSDALVLPTLTELWVRFVLTRFSAVTESGAVVFVADGIKVGKEGKQMPAVKCLHQQSENCTKSEFFMGHSFQALSLLVTAATGQAVAVPLLSRICEGLRTKRGGWRESQLDRLAQMFLSVTRVTGRAGILVADAYYATRTIIIPLLGEGHHLVTRVRWNTVGYEQARPPRTPRPGRPRKYGDKHHVWDFFNGWSNALQAQSPVYGEEKVTLEYSSVDLLWRPIGRMARFVLVKHPTRGKLILLTTNMSLDPIAVIKLYGLRFKIEVSFKQAINTIGAYAYHFSMMEMTPIKWGAGDQSLINRSDKYRQAVARKIAAYHRYVQIACIVQGLLLHLAINYREKVWATFKGWLRTMRPDLIPTEMVVAHALRESFPEYLVGNGGDGTLAKFILDRADQSRLAGLQLTG